MDKIVYFFNNNQRTDYCAGEKYEAFLDYAFERTDYFMLVYVNDSGRGYTQIMKQFRDELRPFKVKSRTNASWPGTRWTYTPFSPKPSSCKVVFYRNDPAAKLILKKVHKMSDWTRPSYPQDLAFFKGNQCWFTSTGHETIAGILHATKEDIAELDRIGIPHNKPFVPKDLHDMDYCDEDFSKCRR